LIHLTFAKRISECPACESSSVRRSTRKGFVERVWFRFAFVWPYRCDDCDSRFWGFRRSYQASDGMFGWGLTRLMQESPIAVARKLFEATANAAREFKLIRTEASE
jgi:transposase-like protein